MKNRGRKFELNKAEGKMLGVCAGFADYTGIDATIIRVGLVLATVLGAFPWTIIAYLIAGLMAKPRALGTSLDRPRLAADDGADRMRNLDLRMQAIETYVTSSNSRLAREIEDLR